MGGARILIEDSYREEKTNPDNKYMTNRKID